MRKFGKFVRVLWFVFCAVVIGVCGVYVYDVAQGQSFTAYASPYEQYLEYKTGNFMYQSKLALKAEMLVDIGDGTGPQPIALDMDMLYDGFMVDPYEHGYMDMHLSFLTMSGTYAAEVYQDASGEKKNTYIRISDGNYHDDWMRTKSFSPIINIPLLMKHEMFLNSSIEETDEGYVMYADAAQLIDVLDLKTVIENTLSPVTGDKESESAFELAAKSASAKYTFDKNYRLTDVELLDFMYYTNSFAVAGIWTIHFYDFDNVLLVDAKVPEAVKATEEVATDENAFWSFTDSHFGMPVEDVDESDLEVHE